MHGKLIQYCNPNDDGRTTNEARISVAHVPLTFIYFSAFHPHDKDFNTETICHA